jgi:hypothetical protein
VAPGRSNTGIRVGWRRAGADRLQGLRGWAIGSLGLQLQQAHAIGSRARHGSGFEGEQWVGRVDERRCGILVPGSVRRSFVRVV